MFAKAMEYTEELVERGDSPSGSILEAIEYGCCINEDKGMGMWGGTDGSLEWVRSTILKVLTSSDDGDKSDASDTQDRLTKVDLMSWESKLAEEEEAYEIDEMLDGSTAKDKDLTFQDGPLLSNNDDSNSYCSFEVEGIEAFGVGSSQVIEDALNSREEHRIKAQKKIRNAMKGAKAAFLEDMQSGLVGGKVFKHRDEVVGRDGGCDMDRSDESEK